MQLKSIISANCVRDISITSLKLWNCAADAADMCLFVLWKKKDKKNITITTIYWVWFILDKKSPSPPLSASQIFSLLHCTVKFQFDSLFIYWIFLLLPNCVFIFVYCVFNEKKDTLREREPVIFLYWCVYLCVMRKIRTVVCYFS